VARQAPKSKGPLRWEWESGLIAFPHPLTEALAFCVSAQLRIAALETKQEPCFFIFSTAVAAVVPPGLLEFLVFRRSVESIIPYSFHLYWPSQMPAAVAAST
jgi:hypothetical protein